jgi:hypothetical protein
MSRLSISRAEINFVWSSTLSFTDFASSTGNVNCTAPLEDFVAVMSPQYSERKVTFENDEEAVNRVCAAAKVACPHIVNSFLGVNLNG